MFYPRDYLNRKDLSLHIRAEINAALKQAVANDLPLTFAEAKYLGTVLEATFTFDEEAIVLLEKIYAQLDIYKFWNIYMRYAKDLDGAGIIRSPRGPVPQFQKLIDVAYLQRECDAWKPQVQKTNHKHTVMQFLSKQAREELKEALAWSKQLQEGYLRRLYVERSVILFSRNVFIKAEEYYQEYDARKDQMIFCGQETIVDGFAYTHILIRHFSPYNKFGRPGLTFHHDREIDVDNLPFVIFHFLSLYDQDFGIAVLTPRPTDTAPIIELLANLIVTKLIEHELNIGIAYLSSGRHAIVSLDEYAKHDFNLHLYCSTDLTFFIGIEKENDEGELVEDLFPLAEDDLLTIPSGLQDLMGKVAASGKETVFRARALD